MNGSKRAQSGLWLPALSGLLLGISYLPGPFLLLNVAAFLPLLSWLETHREARALQRLRAGLVFGVVTHLVAMHWQYSMLTFSWLAVLLYVGMAAALGLRIALSVALAGWLRRRTGQSWGLLLPIVWIPFEWAQTWGDLRLTGEHLAHTVAGYPFLVQFADLFGPYGVGAWLLASNGLLFVAVSARGTRQGRRALALLALLWTATLAYDAWAWTRADPSGETVRVGLVQPNVPLEIKHRADMAADQSATLASMTRQAVAQGAEIVLWPESARPDPIYHHLDLPESWAMPEVQLLARQTQAAILLGVEYARIDQQQQRRWYNAAVAVDALGQMVDTWGAKVYLVPFAEGVPFRRLLGPLVEGRGGEWRWVAGGFDPGPRSALVEVAGAKVGVLVCYEQLFFDLARGLRNAGAELQVVLTNDAWFGRSLFQTYQANALRLRAIENRTSIVRVANTGISGFVDHRGRYHQRTALFAPAVEVREVLLTRGRTLYDRCGDVVAWAAVAGLIGLSLLARGTAGRHAARLPLPLPGRTT